MKINIKELLSEESLAIICMTIVILVSFYIFYTQDKWDALPPFFLTCVTAIFSFFAYKHSKEKFRLDLLEKRIYIYENMHDFLKSSMNTNRRDDKKHEELFLKDQMFRNELYPKIKFLFGNEVKDFFDVFYNSHTWLDIYRDIDNFDTNERKDLRLTALEHRKKLSKIYEEMPGIFKPYIYFGDYRNSTLESKK